MSDSGGRAVVIGGGIAGLTAAWELSRRGRPVTLLERREVLGGLARSVPLGERQVEVYYHFICAEDRSLLELVEELGLGAHLRWAPARTEWYARGRRHPFTTPLDILRFRPLPLGDRLRFGRFAARCRARSRWEPLDALTAETWLRREIGHRAYRVLFRPLLEGKFGRWAGQISAPWIWHRLHRSSRSRRSLLRPESFGCLDQGSSLLIETLAQRLREAGGEIRTGEPATGLILREGRVAAVQTAAGEHEADVVIAALPLPELTALLPEAAEAYRRELASIPFLGVRCLLLRLREPLGEAYWVNVSDSQVGFPGFIEYSNLNRAAAEALGALVYVPLYLDREDPRWAAPELELAAELETGLRRMAPDIQPWSDLREGGMRGYLLSADDYAQAVTAPGFAARIPQRDTPVAGLHLLDSTQLYPSDRCLSGMIGLARQLAPSVQAGAEA